MADERMNYQSMEAMSKAFVKAHNDLTTTQKELEKIAKSITDGALLGDAGKAFAELINTTWKDKMSRIEDKMNELAGDVTDAMEANKEAVGQSKDLFTN